MQGDPGASSEKARVLIVDDHPVVRAGLTQLIGKEEDLAVCGEASSQCAALKVIAELRPDIATVDISLKGGDGIELIKDIKVRHPHLPVLVLSMHDESLYAPRALRAGAKGYVMKQEAAETLVAAIRQVLAGKMWVSEKVAARMLQNFADGQCSGSPGPLEVLTDRELEVFEQIGRGLTTRQVAARLHLSVKTIESHQAKIRQKLTLKSARELVRVATMWVERDSG